MRARLFALAALFAILFASCAGPSAAPVSTAVPSPSATAVPHAPEIRFALVGNVTDVNVWALFDAKGYSYNNYAVRNEYWPRLYRLSIPARTFETMAASAMPSPVQQEGNFYAATIPLRPDLKWSDGSAFTAEDVAFTVNTALAFQLGFDWHDFYNSDYLDHAQALDARTVKFFFKKQPNVGVWQYGALQGPIVQKAYWSPKIAASSALLPVGGALATPAAKPDEAAKAAREALYALDHSNEPTLGNWIPADRQNGVWINKANPATPFDAPHFDRAAYQVFPSEADALMALVNNNADAILEPDGISADALKQFSSNPSVIVKSNPTSSLRFLIFNTANANMADPVLRQALACVMDQQNLPGRGQIFPLEGFVAPGGWFGNQAGSSFPCKGLDDSARLSQAVKMLSSAGYSWSQPPSGNVAGQGLKFPNGQAVAPMALLAPKSDSLRVLAATYIQQRAALLGIPLAAQPATPDEIVYAVFSSRQYDTAMLGWRVSEYPGYLCEWFGDGNPFHYDGSRLKSACDALNSTSDLNQAQQQADQIQSALTRDLPMIPLFSGAISDAYRNISYPFDSAPGGLSGYYGAPSFAIPAPR